MSGERFAGWRGQVTWPSRYCIHCGSTHEVTERRDSATGITIVTCPYAPREQFRLVQR